MFILKEKKKHIGIYQIWEINKYTKEKKQIDEIVNLLTNECLDREVQIFAGVTPDVQIKYVALGDNNTAPAATDTILYNEQFRTPFVSQTKTDTGELTTDFYVTDVEANFEFEEMGIFAGAAASATENSGILLSRVLYNYTKTSSIEILIRRVDTIS